MEKPGGRRPHRRSLRFARDDSKESVADANAADSQNGETPLHSALCTADRVQHDMVLRVLLSRGANPETPLHRAAAFGNEATIELLLKYGAKVDARDAYGDSPLSWASWILRLLCFGNFKIRPNRQSMRAYLLGNPWDQETR